MHMHTYACTTVLHMYTHVLKMKNVWLKMHDIVDLPIFKYGKKSEVDQC